MLKSVIFASNGTYIGLDEENKPVPEEGGCAWLTILQSKLDRGVIDGKTEVAMVGWPARPITVGDLIRQGKLR